MPIERGSRWRARVESLDPADALFNRVVVNGMYENEVAIKPADDFGPIVTATPASFTAAYVLEAPAPEAADEDIFANQGGWV